MYFFCFIIVCLYVTKLASIGLTRLGILNCIFCTFFHVFSIYNCGLYNYYAHVMHIYVRIRNTCLYNNSTLWWCVTDKNIHHKQDEDGKLPEPKLPPTPYHSYSHMAMGEGDGNCSSNSLSVVEMSPYTPPQPLVSNPACRLGRADSRENFHCHAHLLETVRGYYKLCEISLSKMW